MYYLEISEKFSAAHALRNYDGACRNVHGHNWQLKIGFVAEGMDKDGMVVDYYVLKSAVTKIVAEFDHQNINDHEFFAQNNPTSENISKYIFTRLKEDCPPAVRLDYVRIWETEDFSVCYREK